MVGVLLLGGSGAPTSFGLTDVASGRLFQRTKGTTTGPVTASGTYSGGTPSEIEMQVLRKSDNSVVVDWSAASETQGGGLWSATLSGVPQGGTYYVKARPANATGLAQSGTNPFFVGMLFLCYGQSNMGTFVGANTPTPPAVPSQGAATSWFVRAVPPVGQVPHTWGTVPSAHGIREFLNTVASASGVPCAAVEGSVAGTAIGNLSKGQGLYENFLADIVLAGGDGEAILWIQGEGDAPTATTEAQYKTMLSQLHTDFCTDIGRTKAQLPLYTCSLGIFTGTANPVGYEKINVALFNAGVEQAPDLIWSHTKVDSLNVDTQHQDGPSNGKVGVRFARSVTERMGVTTTGRVAWYITGSATVDATHTDVTLTHSLGTDFTPTSAITGFDVSGDNGGSWAAATAGVRTNATKINLTHTSLATDSARKLRYLYGDNPVRTGMVFDNSSLVVPLTPSYGVLSPTPLSVSAVPTWRYGGAQPNVPSPTVQTTTGIPIGSTGNMTRRMIIITGTATHATSANFTSLVVAPNVGTAKTITTRLVTTGSNPGAVIFTCILDADSDTATSISVTTNYVSNPSGNSVINVWTIPSGDLLSTTPVGTLQVSGTSTTTLSGTLATATGGFIIAVGFGNFGSGGPTATISDSGGVETWPPTDRYDAWTGTHAVASDCTNTTASGARNVTIVWSTSVGTPRMAAASWR